MLISAMLSITVQADGTVITADGVLIPADGSTVLIEAEDYTSANAPNLTVEAAEAASGGSQLMNFNQNYTVSYQINVEEAGYYEFFVKMGRRGSGVCRFRISIADGNARDFVEMTTTNSWTSFKNCRVSVWVPAGEQTFTLTNINTNAFSVDCFNVRRYTPVSIPADGTPITIEGEYDFAGVNSASGPYKYLDTQGNTPSNIWYIGDFFAGSSVSYEVNAPVTGLYEIGVWMASANTGMQFEISGGNKRVTSEVISTTGGWSNYQEKKVVLPLAAGVSELTLKNLSGTWNLDRFTVKLLAADGVNIDITPYSILTGATSGMASRLIDNNAATGWEAVGAAGQTAVIRYNTPVVIDSIHLYDLPTSHVTSGLLTFSNGNTISVGELSTDGITVLCEQENVYWARFDILGATTANAGLQQMNLMGYFNSQNTRMDIGLDATVISTVGLAQMDQLLTGCKISNGRLSMTLAKENALDEIQLTGLPSGTFDISVSLDGRSAQVYSVTTTNGFASVKLGDVFYASSIMLTIAEIMGETNLLGVSVVGPTASELPRYRNYYDVYIFVRYWNSLPEDTYLFINDNNELSYRGVSLEPVPSAKWKLVANADGEYTIQNEDGRYMALTSSRNEISFVQTLPANNGGLWTLQAATSPYIRFVNKAYPTRKINIEGLTGVATATTNVNDSWYSAMWQFKSSLPPQPWDHWYEIGKNSIIGTAGTAIAASNTSITSNTGGSSRTWSQIAAFNPAQYPQFTSDNTMANAVYNLTMQEVYQASTSGVLLTGVSWSSVWTRDTAMSVHSSLAWVVPAISATSLRTKVVGNMTPSNANYPQTLQQDTGTGGSYPMSDDKILIMVAMWEHYLSTGNLTELSHFYDLTCNTFDQDKHIVYDPKTGLFRGETGGLDHRAKTYPNWMAESSVDGVINIAEGKAAIVNVVYAHAMKLLGKSALILGKGQAVADEWFARSEALIKAINDQLWLPERGMYASWQYPEYMGNVNADKVDVISNGYAVLFDIAPPDRAESILENYPLVVYGAPTVWPQKNRAEPEGDLIYHNKGVWPGWEVTLMMGAKEKGHNQVAEEIWKSTVRAAAMSLTNKEVVNYSTGEGIRSDRQLWSVAGTLSGYYRVLFGMVYDEDGITFDPYVPDWLEGTSTLRNYTYRDSTLTLTVTGKGDILTSLKVDGESKPLDYKFPANLTGSHTIEMTVSDSGHRDEINIKPINWVLCPPLPVLNYSNGTLSWRPDNLYTYKLWNGKQFVDVTGRDTYPVDAARFGVYSLVAVASNGVTSEMSKPVIVGNSANVIRIEAEDGTYRSGTFANTTGNNRAGFSGTGYVIDSRATSANMTFDVAIPEWKGGVYLLSAQYSNPGSGDALSNNTCGIRSVYIDGQDIGTFVLPVQQTNTVGGWGRSNYLKITLLPGQHTVQVFMDTANWYDRNMNITSNNVVYDYFTLQLVELDPPFQASVSIASDSEKVTAQFIVNNENFETEQVPCRFILAVYDDENRLVKITTIDWDGTSDKYSFIEEITADLPAAYSAKAFIWNSLTLEPLCMSAET
jgi:hypothetical protein